MCLLRFVLEKANELVEVLDYLIKMWICRLNDNSGVVSTAHTE